MSTTATPSQRTKDEHVDADSFLNGIEKHLVEPWAVLWLFGPGGPRGMCVTEDGVTEAAEHGYCVANLAHRVAIEAVERFRQESEDYPPPPELEGFRDDVQAHMELAKRALDGMGTDNRTWLETLRSAFVVMDRLVREWGRLRSEVDAGRPYSPEPHPPTDGGTP